MLNLWKDDDDEVMNIWKSYTRTVGWRINTIYVQDGGTTSFLKTIDGSCPKIRLFCRLYINIFKWNQDQSWKFVWIIQASHGYSINLLVSHVSQNLLAKRNFWAFLCSYTLEFSPFPPIFLFFIYGTVSGAFLHHVFLADKDYFCSTYNHKSEFWWSVYSVRFHMSLVTFIHWLDFCLSGGGLVTDIYSFFWGGGGGWGNVKERVYRF